MKEGEPMQLEDLRPCRTAPPLSPEQRGQLQAELHRRVAACDWFTIGVMASDSQQAWQALRDFEEALGWSPLSPAEGSPATETGPVFLKGHQRTGQVLERREDGLGEGVLLTGHSDSDPAVEDTWGPLPLDFFHPADPTVHGGEPPGL